MPTFIVYASYSHEAIKGLMAKPENRREAVAQLVKGAGGTLRHMWITTGRHDVVCVVDAPDGADAVAGAMASAASGVAARIETVRAFDPEELVGIAKKARAALEGFRPPGS